MPKETGDDCHELFGSAVHFGKEHSEAEIARVDFAALETSLVGPDQVGVQVPLLADLVRRAKVSVAELRENLAEHYVRVFY